MSGLYYSFCFLLRTLFALPPGTPPGMARTWRALMPASAVLWALTVAGIWVPWDARAQGVMRAAAVTTAIIAAACRLHATRISEDRRMLNRALGDAVSLIPADRRRGMLMREVSGR